jgi:hypothetical protein
MPFKSARNLGAILDVNLNGKGAMLEQDIPDWENPNGIRL